MALSKGFFHIGFESDLSAYNSSSKVVRLENDGYIVLSSNVNNTSYYIKAYIDGKNILILNDKVNISSGFSISSIYIRKGTKFYYTSSGYAIGTNAWIMFQAIQRYDG